MYVCMYFCPIALARTSSTMLNGSDKSGHPCLISDLRETGFNLALLYMMLPVGLSYMPLNIFTDF